MAAQNPPSFLQNVATETAVEARNLVLGLLGGTANGHLSSNNGGVVGSADLVVSQHSTGNMSVDVSGGAAFILGTQNATQGVYHCWSDSTVTNLVVAASDPTNPRIDRVVAQVEDAFYSGANNDWKLAVVTGTPTAGATLVNLNGVGAAPANAITLAYLLVGATVTSVLTANIGDARPFAQRAQQFTFTVVGPPASGVHVTGDEVVDRWGALWRCIANGNPGTWVWAGGGQYNASMYLSTGPAYTANTVIPFDTKLFDVASSVTTGAAAKYTAPVPGVYQVSAQIRTTASTSGLIYIFKNGSDVMNGMGQSTSGIFAATVSGLVKCAAGDTIQALYSSPATINANASGADTYLQVSLIGS